MVNEEIEDLKSELTLYNGKNIADNENKSKIQESQEKKERNEGIFPLTKINFQPYMKTPSNYWAFMSNFQ